jgi:hypothetical protein
MKFKGDVIITDPCYIMRDKEFGYKDTNDWERCNYGENMEVLGITNYLCERTGYGDWSCTVFQRKPKKELGNFCADAGMVCVCLLKDVLKYNPNFDYHIKRKWTTAWIKKFDGDIEIQREYDGIAQVVGKGNINFYSTQTGL